MTRFAIVAAFLFVFGTYPVGAGEHPHSKELKDRINHLKDQEKGALKKADDKYRGLWHHDQKQDQSPGQPSGKQPSSLHQVNETFKPTLAHNDKHIEHLRHEEERTRHEKRDAIRKMREEGKSPEQIRKVAGEFDHRLGELQSKMGNAEQEHHELVGDRNAALGQSTEKHEEHRVREKHEEETKAIKAEYQAKIEALEKQLRELEKKKTSEKNGTSNSGNQSPVKSAAE
jgi:DNA repair exonuclease SbcCD ATPase subunit